MKREKIYQTPRQRAWIEIRKVSEFTVSMIADNAKMKYESAREFIALLVKADVVELLREEKVNEHEKSIKRKIFKLKKDLGYTVPKMTKKGEIISEVTGNKAMWNTLRITRNAVSARELVGLSATETIRISLETANEYLMALHKAGYLERVKEAHNGGGKAKYRLLPNMNTGPNPPQIQRTKQVFDPNISKVVYRDKPELEEELKDGLLA